MIEKGKVSEIAGGYAKVAFLDKDNLVSGKLPIANHVGTLAVGDTVIVGFWNQTDGAIIAKVSG